MNMLTKRWYQQSIWHPFIILMMPLSWLFALLIRIRLWLYQTNILSRYTFKRGIVIVVGNITVGGTGKTPFVIWLANFLQCRGFKPAIISRGYGGTVQSKKPYAVQINDSARLVSDEAILLRRHAAACPVFIGACKAEAARYIATHTSCNVIICDDGLQHYRLKRDMEIALIDGTRAFGNGQLLPAGPLREPIKRLRSVDFTITTTTTLNCDADMSHADHKHFQMALIPQAFIRVNNGHVSQSLAAFNKQKVHAIAAIGNPERFFATLRTLGLTVIPHPFSDHYCFTAKDFLFDDDFPIVMTEKDAVKCAGFAQNHWWYLSIESKFENAFADKVYAKIKDHFDEKEMKHAKKLDHNCAHVVND